MSIELLKMRQEFEAWAGSDQSWLPNVKRGRNGVYTSLATGAAWHAWQEAARLALEDAAKVCESRIDSAKEEEALAKFNAAYGGDVRTAVDRGNFHQTVSLWNSALRQCADAIRALAAPGAGKGGGS